MKIFEKKVENVFYTACKYHEDWLISFENIAKRDRSFFVRPHSSWQPTVFSKTWVPTLKMKDFPKMSKNQEICETTNPRNFFPN